ncbi:FtsX-like permease family protein [Alkalimonas sp. NCh-2]|uniref:ABC transporter permease n=1 Tax=Alkalimonas sp. NCh-2 TaxID=3144846 RepID=UPI0031F61D8E
MWASIAWRLFWRELKRGELWVIAFALFLAVFSVVMLTGITESVRSALYQRSASFLAADLVLRSSRPFQPELIDTADKLQLQQAQQMLFDSMLFSTDEMQLVTVKAVSSAFPLRGELLLRRSSQPGQGDLASFRQGEIWLEPRLLSLLAVSPGDSLELGMASLLVAGVIEAEPDAPLNVFGGNPRVLMHLDDVAATEVVQPGSRIGYRYLFAGSAAQLAELRQQLDPQLSVHEQWQELDPETAIGAAMQRAESFLLLAGLLGIVLAASASAVAANRYRQRHAEAVAVIKALGATTATARKIYCSHLLLVSVFSSVLAIATGIVLVVFIQQGIQLWMEDYQPAFSSRPFGMGLLTALICAGLFAARPVWQLAAVPAIAVLRQLPAWRFDVWHLATGALAVWLLMWLFSRELVLSLILFAACVVFALVLMALAAVLVKVAKPMAAGQSSALKLALANLRRRLWQNSFQLLTFSMALFLTLLLYFLRVELLDQWQQQIPEGAPNQFLVNISAAERPGIEAFAEQHQLQLDAFYPIVRGRLTATNQQQLRQRASKEEDTERVGVGRELNLTWTEQLPANNSVLAGRWFDAQTTAEVSVESELAERLGIELGDELEFSIGGRTVSASVSSIRLVDWNTLQPNFYMILSADLLADFPASYLSAFYLEAERAQVLNQLNREFPTVIVLNVDAIIQQVQDIIAQVTIALSSILLLVFAAAVLVLVAQVQATMEQREQELAILRTLGARYAFLRNAMLLEFAALGALAGILATVLAEAVLGVLQFRLFELPFQLHWNLWWIGPGFGMLVVTLLGWWQLRQLLAIQSSVLMRRAIYS